MLSQKSVVLSTRVFCDGICLTNLEILCPNFSLGITLFPRGYLNQTKGNPQRVIKSTQSKYFPFFPCMFWGLVCSHYDELYMKTVCVCVCVCACAVECACECGVCGGVCVCVSVCVSVCMCVCVCVWVACVCVRGVEAWCGSVWECEVVSGPSEGAGGLIEEI